jgi:hypothetical protein
MSRGKTRDRGVGRGWAGSARAFVLGVAGALAATAVHADVHVGRSWAGAAPTIDGTVDPGEWSGAEVTTLARGRMATMNDGRHLYVLLDVTSDTVDDPITPADGEFFTLAFDVDLNRAVTSGADLAYVTCYGGGRAVAKAYYLAGGAFTGCQSLSPASAGRVGFGITPASSVLHRVWELRLTFPEIGVDPATWGAGTGVPHVRFNVGLASATPSFMQAEPDPALYPGFGNTFRVDLATAPSFPPGSTGPTFAGVGLVPATYIDALGYADLDVPGYSYSAMDAPFGGTLNVFGNWSDLYARGARSYRVLQAAGGAAPVPLLHTWSNMRFLGAAWTPRAFGPDAAGRYPVPAPGENWYLSNLLVAWPTRTVADGTYTLSLELFDASGTPLPAPPDNSLTLRVVNTPPVARIHRMFYGVTEVAACSIVHEGPVPADFTFEITASDANGALAGWSLGADYGDNGHSPIDADGYAAHRDGDGPSRWNGFSTTVIPATWRPPTPCAYAIRLSASSRSQNGYGAAVPTAHYTKTLTYLLGEPGDCK